MTMSDRDGIVLTNSDNFGIESFAFLVEVSIESSPVCCKPAFIFASFDSADWVDTVLPLPLPLPFPRAFPLSIEAPLSSSAF
jgi:hypothetical protein